MDVIASKENCACATVWTWWYVGMRMHGVNGYDGKKEKSYLLQAQG